MICGTVPFKAQNMHDLHQIITSGQFTFPSQLLSILSNESKDLISKMLVLNPKDRISIPEILSHPWMLVKDDLMISDDPLDLENGMSKKDFMMAI
jgi:serine/threonine protein kinase